MDAIEVSPEFLLVMSELAYTASETGLIPFAFHDDDDLAAMVKLVRIAEEYQHGLPNSLRM
jgi:hypothetical protein